MQAKLCQHHGLNVPRDYIDPAGLEQRQVGAKKQREKGSFIFLGLRHVIDGNIAMNVHDSQSTKSASSHGCP